LYIVNNNYDGQENQFYLKLRLKSKVKEH
jgi:hypothetical protein